MEQVKLKDGAFELIHKALKSVVDNATGRAAKIKGIAVYGKTGTAEVGSRSFRRNITHFIAFLHHQGRTYALALTVEDGQSGGRTCAPIAAEFFREFLLD